MAFWCVKKPNFSYTFAFEKRTQNELHFGHDQKTLFALTRSGPTPSRLQYLGHQQRHR